MRYLKICVLSCFLLLPIFVLTASAHTGRTDSNGGHYDRSTGEYHYHHGYPAHDHYDMDGDEIVDCPYDFDDRTGENSGSSSGSSGGNAGIDAWEKYKRENPDLFSEKVTTEPTHSTTVPAKSPVVLESKPEAGGNRIMWWIFWSVVAAAVVAIFLAYYYMKDRNKCKAEIKLLEMTLQISEDKLLKTQRNTTEIVDDLTKKSEKSEAYRNLEKQQYEHELAKLKKRVSQLTKDRDFLQRVKEQNGELLIRSHQAKEEMSETVKESERKCKEYRERYEAIMEILPRIVKPDQILTVKDYSWRNPLPKDILKQLQVDISVPNHIFFDRSGKPILLEIQQNYPYGRYTVFSSKSSNIYHLDYYCAGYQRETMHLFDAIKLRKRPCFRCAKNSGLPNTIPQWYIDIQKIREMQKREP